MDESTSRHLGLCKTIVMKMVIMMTRRMISVALDDGLKSQQVSCNSNGAALLPCSRGGGIIVIARSAPDSEGCTTS